MVAGLLALLFAVWWVWPRKKTYYGQTMGDPAPPVRSEGEPVEKSPMTPGARLFAICFLSVWLVGWTFGVYHAFLEWLDLDYGESGFAFLSIWLAFGIPGWFFVAWTIFRLLRGDEIDIQFDGDGDGGD